MSTTESAPPRPAATDEPVPGDGLILDPNAPGFDHLEPRDREAIEATIAWFEERGKVALKDADREHRWYDDYLAFQARGGDLLPVPDAGARRRRRSGAALGHAADLRVQRGLRVLRARLLVHVAGHDPRARADLPVRQRGGPRPRRAAAGGRRDLRVRPLRARPRRRHLLDRHDPLAASTAMAGLANGGKYYIGNGNEAAMVSVFGRMEGDRGARRLRVLRRRLPAPELRADPQRRQLAELRQPVRAARLPGDRRRTSCTPGPEHSTRR